MSINGVCLESNLDLVSVCTLNWNNVPYYNIFCVEYVQFTKTIFSLSNCFLIPSFLFICFSHVQKVVIKLNIPKSLLNYYLCVCALLRCYLVNPCRSLWSPLPWELARFLSAKRVSVRSFLFLCQW